MLYIVTNQINAHEVLKKEQYFSYRFSNQYLEAIGNHKIPIDITHTPTDYYVEAELAGISRDEITVSTIDSELTIEVHQKLTYDQLKLDYIQKERAVGSFTRTITLGNMNTSLIHVKFNKGILTIHIPKLVPDPVPTVKNIPIKFT